MFICFNCGGIVVNSEKNKIKAVLMGYVTFCECKVPMLMRFKIGKQNK